MFRRAQFLTGESPLGSGLPDSWWFRTDGRKMTRRDWGDGGAAHRSGCSSTARRSRARTPDGRAGRRRRRSSSCSTPHPSRRRSCCRPAGSAPAGRSSSRPPSRRGGTPPVAGAGERRGRSPRSISSCAAAVAPSLPGCPRSPAPCRPRWPPVPRATVAATKGVEMTGRFWSPTPRGTARRARWRSRSPEPCASGCCASTCCRGRRGRRPRGVRRRRTRRRASTWAAGTATRAGFARHFERRALRAAGRRVRARADRRRSRASRGPEKQFRAAVEKLPFEPIADGAVRRRGRPGQAALPVQPHAGRRRARLGPDPRVGAAKSPTAPVAFPPRGSLPSASGGAAPRTGR